MTTHYQGERAIDIKPTVFILQRDFLRGDTTFPVAAGRLRAGDIISLSSGPQMKRREIIIIYPSRGRLVVSRAYGHLGAKDWKRGTRAVLIGRQFIA